MISTFVVLLFFSQLGWLHAATRWNIALSSRVDDNTFYYDSPVWNSTSSFNTSSYQTSNALFEAFYSVYVQKIRITLDGTSEETCGNNCVFTFSLPQDYSGKFTLRELVNQDGGVEMIDDKGTKWINTDEDYFQFGTTYDKYYCHEMGLNFANYPRAFERYDQRTRARIGVMMNYYQPCIAWRAVEGIGLRYGWMRQWTDNVGSGRLQAYSSYTFRPALVEVFGDESSRGTLLSTFVTAKVDDFTRYPVQVYQFNSSLVSNLHEKTTFAFMFRLKRETRYYDSQVFRLGTSYLYQYFVMRQERPGYYPYQNYYWYYQNYWDGRKWYSYQASTYTTYDYLSPYHTNFAVGRWYHVDGFPTVCWPFYAGQKLLSKEDEIFSLSRGGATAVAEISDFRYYNRMLLKPELDTIREDWLSFRKGCGDGERDVNEECDDGNYEDGDGCSSECTRESGFVCSGSNSTTIRPDSCEPGQYLVDLNFDQYDDGATQTSLHVPAQSWSFSVDNGWAGWDMTGTFTGTNYLNMALGSQSLASATCSKPEQYCCDATFGKMIGGLRMCGNNCQLKSTFTNLPSHNYVRVKVQMALIDQHYYNWMYMYADDELRMRVRKTYWTLPATNTQACLPMTNRGALGCYVNYCGSSGVQDDLITFDVYFFHNSSSLSLKFTNTLTSSTSRAIGYTFLDMEVGFTPEFVLQTEGAGGIEVAAKYSPRASGKGLKLWNFPFPSYEYRSGSSFSHFIVPVPGILRENAFVEFKYNLYTMPRYYKGFYLTLIRADRGASQDVFTMNLEACSDATPSTVSTKCSPVTFYRICYDSDYEPTSYWAESRSFCDERRYANYGTWLSENVEIFSKFSEKYGINRGLQEGEVYLQFGIYGDYYGDERKVEVFLDDIKVAQRQSSSINTCPDLHVTASSTGASFNISGLPVIDVGTGDWKVLHINSSTHAALGGVATYTTNDLVSYVKSLPYGSMLMVAHSGPITCDSDCSAMIQSLGGTSFPHSAFGPSYSLAAIGIAGIGVNSMPFSITPYQDGVSSVSSSIGCHEQVVSVGENFHAQGAMGKAMKPISGGTYAVDESSMGYLGCYLFGATETTWVHMGGSGWWMHMTPGMCSQLCHDSGFAYAAMWIHYYCYCGDSYGKATYTYSTYQPVSEVAPVSNKYCSMYICTGDYSQYCAGYTYYSVYQARSAVPYNIDSSAVTCDNAYNSAYCSYILDNNYGTYYRSWNSDPANVTMDLGEVRAVDSLRIYAAYYMLETYDLLCGDDAGDYCSIRGVIDFVSDNYEGSSGYITYIDAEGAECRYLKLRLLKTKGSYFSIRDMRINLMPSLADKQRMDTYTATSQFNYRNITNGKVMVNFAYPSYVTSNMPWARIYDMVNVDAGNGQLWFSKSKFDFEFLRSYHVRIKATIKQYDSAWFVMSDTANYLQLEHGLGTMPWNTRVTVRVQSGANAGFIFQGTGSIMVDGSEIGSVTYGGVSYPETYGGLLFAFDSQYIRLWAPSGTNGYIVNIAGGWGQTNLQSAKAADVRVRSSPGTTPQFDSGWVTMQSQTNNPSLVQQDFVHGLEDIKYAIVKVFYRPTSGPNSGFVFEAAGSAQADDDGGSYGGVVFGYTEEIVRVWMPNNTDSSSDNCDSGFNKWSLTTGTSSCTACSTLGGYPCTHKDGYAVYVPSGFGGGTHTQMSHDVEVRVRIWTYEYNKPTFVTLPLTLTSNGVAYRESTHSAGPDHSRVFAVCAATLYDFPYYFAGITASAGTDRRPRVYGGVIYAYDSTRLRLWAPAQSLSNMWQAYGQGVIVSDGWGNGTTTVASQEVAVNVLFYEEAVGDGLDIKDTSRISINVENNNEIPMVKSKDITIVEETYPSGHILTSLSAYDPDGTAVSEFVFVSGNNDDAFGLDASGNLLVNNAAAIDFEKYQNFSLQIAVSDGHLTDLASVFVTVLDKNDIPVMWPPYGREVREGSAINTLVGAEMNATDTDVAQSILYYLLDEGNHDNAFTMTTCSGQLRVSNPDALDFEGVTGYNFFNLSVLITDDGENAGNRTYIVPITILNRNDPPYWNSSAMVTEVVENTPIGTWIEPNLNEWCKDDDYGDMLSYTLLSVANSDGNAPHETEPGSDDNPIVQNTDFAVNNVTGNMTTGSNNFNFESVFSYRVMIRCTDYNLYEEQEPPNLYVDGYVNVIVIDANDAPVFVGSSLSQGIYENSAINTVAINSPVRANDEDINDHVVYSLLSDYGGLFDIDPNTGNIFQKTSTSLNYEVVQKLQLTVMATDHGILTGNRTADPKSVTAVVNITVGDVNEPPTFVSSSFTVDEVVKRGSPKIGDVVFVVNGTDPDIFATQDLTFAITGANPSGAASLFSVDNNELLSARLLIAKTISYETFTSFTLFFSVQDNGGVPGGSGLGLVGTGQVTVTVTNLNDDPKFDCTTNPSLCTYTLNENSASGVVVGTCSANDEDGDTLSWSFVSPPVSISNRFTINSATGVISVQLAGSNIINYEAVDEYSVTVRVADASTKTNGAGYEDAVFKIKVEDVAEAPYRSSASAIEFGVAKSGEAGTLVGSSLSNFFSDEDDATTLSYAVDSTMEVYPDSGGSYSHSIIFAIDSITGQLSLTAKPSTELGNTVEDDELIFNVTVSDGTFTITELITVVVRDDNLPPVMSNSVCSLAENVIGPVDICQITATDPEGDSITYTLSNPISDYFRMNPDGRLALLSGTSFNYENTNSYTIEIVATDSATYSQSSKATVTVNVIDANDSPSVTNYAFSIPENQDLGVLWFILNFSDEDKQPLQCSVTGTNVFNSGEVNSANTNASVLGILGPSESASVDVSVGASNELAYIYLTLAFDPLSSTSSVASDLVLTITDPSGLQFVYSSWPTSWDSSVAGVYFSGVVVTTTLAGSGTWSLVLTNSRVSGDDVQYSAMIYLSFDGRDVADTSSDTSCFLGLLTSVDFETQPTHKFGVSVSDGTTSRMSNITMTITDINEAPTMNDYTLVISENSVAGTAAVWQSDPSKSSLTANDQEDDNLVFTIVSGNEEGYFEVVEEQSHGPAACRIVVANGANIDFESVSQYVLVLEVNESTTVERLSAQATLVINVIDVNDVMITGVRNTALDAFGNDNAPLDTDGGDIIVVAGSNFGSVHSPEAVRVTYGPFGVEYTASGCSVTPGNNTEIVCTSVAGVGMEHVWQVEVLSSTHKYMTTHSITTYYYRPTLSSLINVKVPGGTYRTIGDEKIRLLGAHTGSSAAAGLWQFVGISKISTLGNNFRLEDPMEDGNHKCRAGSVFYGAALKSNFLLVSDNCPSAGQVTVTVQQKFAADGVSQFNPTNVAANPCIFDRTLDPDWNHINGDGRTIDINSVYDAVILPSADLLVTASAATATLIKACPSNTLWRTYYTPKPIVYYTNFESSTISSPNTTDKVLEGGFSLLAKNCTFNTSSVDCLTTGGVGFNYRARLSIAGMLSDELMDVASFISYNAPVLIGLNSSEPLLDTRGYTPSTPDIVTIRTLFAGSNADYQGYGGGIVKYGKDMSDPSLGTYSAACTISTTGELCTYCRGAGNCFAEQVDVLTCKPVAGIGMQHEWEAVIGGQMSNIAPEKTSYQAPVILSMNPGQWPFDDTAGGASITIVGDQMGPVGLVEAFGTIFAQYGSEKQFESGLLFETVLDSCSITVAHEVMVCLTGEGTGRNHSWRLTIAEQQSNIYAAGSSYVPPILVDFSTYNESLGNGIPEDVLSFSTAGYQIVEIVGRNFGPMYHEDRYNAPITATTLYVDSVGESHLWTYFNCTVVVAHIKMICVTSVGVGAELKWNLIIDNQTNTVPTTAYAPPVLNVISGVGFDISEGIATRGGQYVDLEGDNFGPDLTYVERISFGPSGGEYLLHDAEAKVLNCDMTVPHKVFRCRIPAGYGQRHYFTIKVAGQKTSTVDISDAERISYKTPTISSVTPVEGTSKGKYTITVVGNDFGPSTGAVLMFWDKLYSAFPLTYFNHEKMVFEVPEGQGADRALRVGHASASCLDDCQQFSPAFNFTYISPAVDRLIFADSYLEGYSNLTIYGKTSDSKANLNGGSFGSGLTYSWSSDDGILHEFLNRVWIFAYNVSEAAVDDILTEMYANYDSLSNGDFSELSIPGMPKPCAVTEAYKNVWSHDMINCLTVGTNGTLAVVAYDVHRGVYQRSSLFLFKEKSPVVYTPISTTPLSQADPYPTQGGFMLTIRGLYFGALTVVGESPAGVDVLFYLDGYMDYVKCLDLRVAVPTNNDQETTLTCYAPPGHGKHVAVIVRKGGEGSNSVSDYIYGANCDACISYDPPVVTGYSESTTVRRRMSQTSFPVATSTVGMPSLVIYGKNFGLPGGLQMSASTTLLVEDLTKHSDTNFSVAIPQGVGEEILFSLQVANQKVSLSSNFYMDYFPPTIESVSKTLLHTAGGESIIVTGSDFGMSTATAFTQHYLPEDVSLTYSILSSPTSTVNLVGIDDASYIGFLDLDGARLMVSSWNHTHIEATTVSAKGGTGKNLIVSADDQTDVMIGFAYYPPTITSMSTDHAPTSGTTYAGEKILMTLFGEDFGSKDATKYVTFGPYHINSTQLNTTHNTCAFYIPPGQGVDLPISITVEGQTSNSLYFSYEPPLATGMEPTIGNTDACTQWESLQAYVERLDKDPFAKRMCLSKVYLTLSGYSFGTSGMKIVVTDGQSDSSPSSLSRRLAENSLICETNDAGEVISSGWNCFDCADGTCYHDHESIVVWAPQSYGVNLTVFLYVDGRRDTNSTPIMYSYYPPEITVSSPGSAAQGYGYFDAMGEALTIQGKNLGGTASLVEVNFTSRNFVSGKITQKRCQDAKWNAGRPTVGDGFPYLTCTMPADIVGAKNMTIHVAEQTVEVPVRRNQDNSLFISACKAKYDNDNQQTIYYGLRYYQELCVECPLGARCKPEEYLVDPVADNEFWLLYFDVDDQDASEQCSKYRMPPMTTRDKCPVFSGCFPSEACTGSNTCEKAYSYVLEECNDERRKHAHKYNNNTCSSDYDCNKGEEICEWNEPEKCSYCDKVPGTAEGKCVCVAAPRCSLCKIKEYYRIGGKCVKCPQNVIVLIVLFCTALLAFVVAGYYLNKYKFNLAFVAIGFDYFQVLAIFASSDIVWPPLVIKMFTISMFFSFDINLTAPECAFPDISYEMKWYISMVLPLMGGVVLFLMFWSKLIHKYIWRHKRGWTALTKHGNQLMAMFMIMLYYLYLPLLRKALEIVNCNPADPDDGHLYTEWTSVSCPGGYCRCWEDPDDPQMQLLPWAMLSLVVYAVGYPIYVAYVLFKYKPLIQEDQLLRAMNLGDKRATNPIAYDVRKKYHKLYYHFKPGKTYWMLIVLCRKFWIAVAALLFRSNPTFQLSFILLVLFICYVLQVQHRPFMSTMERESELNRHRMKVEEAMNSKDDKVREQALARHLQIQRSLDNVRRKEEVIKKRAVARADTNKDTSDFRVMEVTADEVKEFFWDFNNVELYLLGCAVFVCIAGIMFESDTYGNSSTLRYHLLLLTFMVVIVVASSLLYFGIVFTSELLTTFGYDASNKIFLMFMSKEYKKKRGKSGEGDELELSAVSMGENPMVKRSESSQEEETKRAMEVASLAEENEQLMKQISDLKKKEQSTRMRSFRSAGGSGISTQKKLKKKSTFDSEDSGTGSRDNISFDSPNDML